MNRSLFISFCMAIVLAGLAPAAPSASSPDSTMVPGNATFASALEHLASIAHPGNEQVQSVNIVVGETNDGYLNDIRGRHVTKAHVLDAIRSAKDGPVEEGAVGAGTGTSCFGYKGGIGTSSRHTRARSRYTFCSSVGRTARAYRVGRRPSQLAGGYSSPEPEADISRICSTTSAFASVVTSPSSRPRATSRSSRRMILPLRVFGSPEAMWITSGAAKAPITWRTCSFSAPCSCSWSLPV